MKNSLRRIMAMALAILMILTSGPLTAVAEIVSGNQQDASEGFSLRSITNYTPTLHAIFTVDGTKVAEQYVLSGEGVLNAPEPPPTKVVDGQKYVFTGWQADDGSVPSFGTTLTFSGDIEIEYKAQYKPVFYVFFLDTTDAVYATKEGKNGDSITISDVSLIVEGDNHFLGWSTEKGSKTPIGNTVTIEDSNITLYPCVDTGKWIYFDSTAGGNYTSATYVAPVFVAPNTKPVMPDAPSCVGYNFAGWVNSDGTAFNADAYVTQETTLFAKWEPKTDIKYTVIHWWQNANDDEYSYESSEELTGTTGEQTAATAKSYTVTDKGLTGTDVTKNDVFTAQTIEQQTIAGDGSTVVNVYYTRKTYTLSFKSSNGKQTLNTLTLKYGQNIANWPLYNDSSLWRITSNNSYNTRYVSNLSTMPLGGGTLYAVDASGDENVATYYVEDLNDSTKFVVHHTDTTKGTASYNVGEEDRYPITGFTLIDEKGTQVGDKYREAEFYYSRNTYDIIYYNGLSVVDTVGYKFEADISNAGSVRPSAPPAGVPANYVFDCWCKDPAGETEYDFTGATMPAEDIILYAKWVPPVLDATVHLRIDGQGGTQLVKIPYGETVDQNMDQMPDVSTITPEGYEFIGWSTEPNAYVRYNTATQVTEDITIYPYYRNTKTFAVIYNDGDTSVELAVPSDGTSYAEGSYAEILAPATTSYEKDGVTLYFSHWEAGDGKKYYPNGSIQIGAADVTLTAKYTVKEDRYTLIYDANGGENGTTVENLYKNQPIDLYMGASRTGYTLKGWSTDSAAEEPEFTSGTISLDGENATETLYAVWMPLERTYTVNFLYQDKNDTSKYTVVSSDQRKAYTGDTVSVTADDKTPNSSDYKFASADEPKTIPAVDTTDSGVVLNVYFDLNTAPYTVHHYLKGTTIQVADDDTGTATIGDTVSANKSTDLYDQYSAAEVASYSPSQSITIAASGNEITVYYTIPVTVTADNKTKTYGEDNPELTATVKGLIGDDTIAYTLSCLATATSPVGEYTITTEAAAEQGYYTVTTENGKLNITGRAVTVEIVGNTSTVTYNGEEQQVTGYEVTSITSNGEAYTGYGESYIVFSGKATAKGTNASTDKYMMGLAASQFTSNDTANYNVTFEVTDGWLKIDPVETEVIVTIVGNNDEVTFDGAAHTVEGYVVTNISNTLYKEADIAFNGDDSETQTNAGTYSMGLAAGQFSNTNTTNFTNVKFQVTDGQLKINQKALHFVGESDTLKYTGSEQEITGIEVSGLVVGHTYSNLTYSAKGTLPAEYTGVFSGDVKITDAAGNDVTANYSITQTPGKLTITNASFAVTFTGESKTLPYNGTEQKITGITVEGLLDGHKWEGVTYEAKGTNVATYDGVFSGTLVIKDENDAVVTDNYAVSYVPGTLTITPITVTVTVQDATKVYGEADPAFTATVTGLVGDDTATYGFSRVAGENVGTYVVSASGAVIEDASGHDVTANYEIAYNTGRLTITQKAVTVTADNKTKVYGTQDPTLTATVTGLVNGEAESLINYTVARAEGENVGEYTITPSGDNDQGNYIVSYATGTLTITPVTDKVTVTITEHSDTVTYDGKEHEVTGYDVSISNPLYTEADFTFSGDATVTGIYADTYPMELKSADFTNNSKNFTNVEFVIVDGTLVINPITAVITITPNGLRKVYDGTPLTQATYTYTQGVLVNGDTLTAVTKGSQTDVGYSFNTIESYEIKNAAGESVKHCYTVVCENKENTLLVTARPVVITANSAEYTYDATSKKAVGADGKLYTVSGTSDDASGLVKGHEVTAAEVLYAGAESQTNVGEYDAVVTQGSVTIMNGSANVTGNYEISYTGGQLVIIKANTLTVSATNGSKVYDSTPLESTPAVPSVTEGTTIEYSLDGETWSTEAPSITDVGSITVKVRATNDNYNEATATYTLTVTPRQVVLTSETARKEYDGTALERPVVTVTGDGFVEGEVTDLKATGSITEVGSVTNTITYTGTGAFKAANYTVTKTEGTLTINKSNVEIVVTPNDATKTYDGTALTQPKATVTGVPEGFTYEVTTAGTITDVGTAKNTVATFVILNADKEDVTDQFASITYGEGILEVTKRSVLVTALMLEYDYDSTAKPVAGTTQYKIENLAENHKEEVVVTYDGELSQIKVGTYVAVPYVTAIKDASGEVVTANYEISYTYNNLYIRQNPAEIVVTPGSAEKVYDGTALTQPEATVTGVPEGFTYEVTTAGTITNVGTEKNTVATFVILNADKEDVTDQFASITYEEGTLTVNKRQVTLKSESASKVYDGTALEKPDVAVTSELGFVDGEVTDITAIGSITEVGSVTNAITYTEGTAFKAGNYVITKEEGTLTITKSTAEIVVTPGSAEKVYDGTALIFADADESQVTAETQVTGVPEGFTYEVTTAGTITDVGTAKNTVATFVILNADKEDVTDQFASITYEEGTLTVNKRQVTLKSESASKVYDGTALEKPDVTVTSELGFVEGEVTDIKATGSIIEVGSVANTITYTEGAAFKADNYEITLEEGTLVVTALDTVVVTITGNSDSYVYNGSEQSVTGYTVEINNDLYTVNDFTFNGDATAKGTNVGEYPMGLEDTDFANINPNFTDVEFVIVDGTMKITPKAVEVNIAGNAKPPYYYDGTEKEMEGYFVSIYEDDGLYSEDYIDFTGTAFASGINAGTYYMGLEVADFANTNENFNVSFTVKDGYLLILPVGSEVIVTIKGNTKTETFNGTAHTVEGYTATSDNALYGAVADTDYTFSGNASVTETNAGTYPMGLAEAQFSNENSNFTNVKFQVTDGQLVINQKAVTVTADDKTKVYGDPDPELTAKVEGLIGEDQIAYTLSREEGENVGEYTITPEGEASQGNYTVAYEEGTLEITRRPLTITANTATFTYNGEAKQAVGEDGKLYTVSATGENTGIVTGHTENVTVLYDGAEAQVNVGEYTAAVTAVTITADGADVTDNYEITLEEGTLVVTALNTVVVTITENSGTYVYNGQEQSVTGYTVEINNDLYTVNDFTFNGDATAKGTNVGEYPMGLEDTDFANANPNFTDVEFVIVDGEMEITKRPITIAANDHLKIPYDAQPHGENDFTVTNTEEGEGLAEGHTVSALTISGERTLVAYYEDELVPSAAAIADASGEDVTDNYAITYVAGDLEIVSDEPVIPGKSTQEVTSNYPLGGRIPFTITVNNITNEELTNVIVTDPTAAIVAGTGYAVTDEHTATIPSIAPGATVTVNAEHYVTSDDILAGTYGNTATVTANNKTVNASSSTDKIASPDVTLTVVKISDVAEGEKVSLGAVITYTITVTNDGNVPYYNVAVTDEWTGDKWTIATLAVGATETFETSYTVTSDDIKAGRVINEVIAVGYPVIDPKTEEELIPEGSAEVEDETDDLNVALAVTKEAGIPDNKETAALNDTVTYEITVTNNGNVPYTNVVVTDPLTGMNETIATLAVGKTVTFTTEYVITSDDVLRGKVDNTVHAKGDGIEDPKTEETLIPEASANETVNTDALDFELKVVKETTSIPANEVAYALGETIEYKITVTNEGNVPFTNVKVVDEWTSDEWTIEELAVGESVSFTTSYTVTSDDILAGEVVNVVTAEAAPITDPAGGEKTPTATDSVTDDTDALNSTLTVVKTSDVAENETVSLGDVITYTITVTNNGNVPFYNVKVVDEWTGDEWTIETLAVGATETFETSYTVTSDDILAGSVLNEVTAEGDPIDDPDNPDVPKTPGGGDEEEDETEDVDSTLTVVKTSDVAEGETVSLGDVITYTITVTNEGNVPFYNVEVVDELTGGKWTVETLAVGASETFETSYTVTSDDILAGSVLNVVTAEGDPIDDPDNPDVPKVPEDDDDVTDETDDVDVTLTVEKTSNANGEPVELGQEITYTITVTNEGNVPYTNVVVTDEWVEEEWTIETLAVGETKTFNAYYTVQESDILTGFVTNYVSAEADPVFDPKNKVELTPADDAEVTDDTADIDATIEVVKVSDVPEGEKVAPGDVINYTITITNVGNVTFSGVAVVDQLPGIVLNEGDGYTLEGEGTVLIEKLEQEQSVVITASYTVVQEDILKGYVVNTVIATGDPIPDPNNPDPIIPEGDGDETDEVIDIDPTLTVTKVTTSTPAGTNGYDLGQAITYAMTVTNDGNIVMHNVVVSDPLTGDSWTVEELAIGETVSFTAAYAGVTSNDILAGKVVNTVYAVAESIPDPKNEGGVITPSGSASVTDIPEDIDVGMSVVKRSQGIPEDGFYRVGETIKYQIKVTNEGNVPYERLEVFDELTGDFWTVYDLKVGETREFYCQYTVKQKDLVRGYVLNRAVVTGDPIDDPKNPNVPKIPYGEGIEIDYTSPTPMGTGIINMNVGDCCE